MIGLKLLGYRYYLSNDLLQENQIQLFNNSTFAIDIVPVFCTENQRHLTKVYPASASTEVSHP